MSVVLSVCLSVLSGVPTSCPLPPQLGLLLACDWLLEVRIKLWETHSKDSFVTKENTPGFYQDVESLSQLATLLPSALSRVRREPSLPIYV